LFDAVEDAAFPIVNNMEGRGSLRDTKEKQMQKEREELIGFLEDFNVKNCFNCSSYSFYPGSVS
jgi:phosphoenolpyruvate carboxylase